MFVSTDELRKIILEDYVEDYSFELGLRQKTIKNKREILTKFLDFLGNQPFTSNSCRRYLRFLRKKEYQASSLNLMMRTLKAAVNFLYKEKHIEYNFSRDIPMPKLKKKPLEIVSAELAEKIIITGTKAGKGDNCINKERKKEHRQALRFILRTGLRNRELRDLRGKDVNLEEETFFVRSKSGNIDVLPIPRDMLGELRKRKDKLQLFKVTAKTLNHSLKRGCKRFGISTKVRTHTLRHIFCTSLLKRGVPIQIVSRLMRHASVTLTDSVYSHYQIDDLKLMLNSYHPLIFQGSNIDIIFDSIVKLINSTSIQKDSRFVTIVKKYKDKIIIKVLLANH